ncbi:MAG: tail sheath stabilizer and completion protein [Candidatus Pacebacteria bacterium]|jgi:hypothetical protein|nr:tail sheath stabilizer and completion protein [Candidatus Paceibacterota bacterium]|tara:strand:+ start:1 stop:909 length:909 start_codon:yes stop_codon:yes gene_type:complete
MGFAGNKYYDHGILKKYVIAFGNLFNDIGIERSDSSGTRVQSIPVPLSYAPKEKFIARLRQDPTLSKDVALQLPRMGFELTSMTYAANRKINTIQRNVKGSTTDPQKLISQYAPVPYDLNFSLFIMVKNSSDATKIMEQILPFFTPEWTIAINTIPEIGRVDDTPIILTSVTSEDVYEGDFDTRRSLIWTLEFVLKGNIYGPLTTSGIIKKIIIDFPVGSGYIKDGVWVPSGNVTPEIISTTGRSERITIQPGLTAANTPTSNTTASVAYTTIQATDNFGFAIDFEHYDDGLKRNPATGVDE